MPEFYRLRRKLRPALVPAIAACLVGYFAYHTVQGDHGLIARHHLRGELARADVTLAALSAERERLELQVGKLSPDHVDLDLLEERVRVMLNFGHPDDVVLYVPDVDTAAAE